MKPIIDLSLDRIRKLLSHLPPYTRPTCHIAGTNGKGSVSALLSSILLESSYSVGRYNSPHLVSVYDCISINNTPVSAAVYANARKRVEDTNEARGTDASNFELLTATALLIFEEAKLDVVVLEVGMGGRLDATNVIPDECVLVSALTAVDLDHQAFLGTTIEAIAGEKAAIARPGRPFALGPQDPRHTATVEAVARQLTQKVGGFLIPAEIPRRREWDVLVDGQPPRLDTLTPQAFAQQDLPPFSQAVEAHVPGLANSKSGSDVVRTVLPLPGAHQLANLGTALAAVSALLTLGPPALGFRERITGETIARGVRMTRWPGRLSLHTLRLPDPDTNGQQEVLVLADGAHNPASAATLAAFVDGVLARRAQATDPATADPAGGSQPRTITLTYLLALSRSPPKTPAQTLAPLFAPHPAAIAPASGHVSIVRRVGLLTFSPPAGMPWVQAERPADVRGVVQELLPGVEVWTPDALEAGRNAPGLVAGTNTGEKEPRAGSGERENTASSGGREGQLRAALAWAAEKQVQDSGSEAAEGLIIVAGSLYLVADFYRLLQSEGQ